MLFHMKDGLDGVSNTRYLSPNNNSDPAEISLFLLALRLLVMPYCSLVHILNSELWIIVTKGTLLLN